MKYTSDKPAAPKERRKEKRSDGVWGRVQAMLDADGFMEPPRPQDDEHPPLLPEDLTALGDEQLMELFTKLTRWLEHIGMRCVRADIIAKEAGLELSVMQARVMQQLALGPKESVTAAKAARDMDPDVQQLNYAYMTKSTYAKALGQLYDGIERRVTTISRELTRRTSIEPYERRSHRWSGG